MKEVIEPKKSFTVELSLDELNFLKTLTGKYITSKDSKLDTYEDQATGLGLYVGTMRILGYKINDDGTIPRESGL